MKSKFSELATVLGKNGYKYLVSTKGEETDVEIIKAAEKFYGEPMERVEAIR